MDGSNNLSKTPKHTGQAPAGGFPSLPKTATCEQCGSRFTAVRDWQRFCSGKCRTKWFTAEQKAALVAWRGKST